MKKTPQKSKRIRHRLPTVTTFEQFPSEIFFEIFDYLSGNHIFKSFFDLNGRFKELVYNASNIHLDLLKFKTKFFRNFGKVFHLQNIVSIVLSYKNVNLLETLVNSTGGIQLKSLSLSAVPLCAFERKIPEVLSIFKHHLISLKIYFADMPYGSCGIYAAQSFGYLLVELPLLKHLVLEHPHGIDFITYMPSSFVNSTIINLTISLRNEKRLIPLLYRFEKLKMLIINYITVCVKLTMPRDAILSYQSQLREKTSIDYPIKLHSIKIYDDQMLPSRLERLFQIVISPTLLNLSLFTGKRPFQIHVMRSRRSPSFNITQWRDLLKSYIFLTRKHFHIEYNDVDNTALVGNLEQVKKKFIKHNELPPSRKVLCSYDQSKNLLSFDVFPV